jgi:hypothetical protein
MQLADDRDSVCGAEESVLKSGRRRLTVGKRLLVKPREEELDIGITGDV